ncbi:hypothetical protein [Rheinheimera texasensis]|jgi:uncharacterized protein (TIGR02285 family)|uniref:hypothetical protein n=1 Tax=Rheinheimera texasensis TaxID=306205 RepID=UPI00068BFFE1|nr:hypothetical protein [Rheinheimera texasensis]
MEFRLSRWLSAFCLGCALVQTTTAAELQWAVNHAPPFHIVDGPLRGQGICDVLIERLHLLLPGVKAKLNQMPQLRVTRELQQQHQLCFACMLQPKQPLSGVIYSDSTHQYRPHQVITRPALADQLRRQFGPQPAFANLLRVPNLRFGYPAGRKYGILQPLIDAHQQQHPQQVLQRTGDNETIAMLNMVAHNRLDYTLEYPFVYQYYRELGGTELTLLPLAEKQAEQLPGVIGCGNAPQNQQLMPKINQVIPELRRDPVFLQALRRWGV